ncbi:hypothetical protein GCM10009555_105790 [Acrocarpospora macrocephala]|uniref:Uncharacterized protein n=1 Tax=Acrocarpospora macrocephala TaxID=150177 RepID=A0A5M3WY17_9ACTN|nr:hypothetical protein Amac_072470 [Acrocarpospora macrocephala]
MSYTLPAPRLHPAKWGTSASTKRNQTDKAASAPAQSKAAKDPESATARSGWARRAQSAADKNPRESCHKK